jgi:hypothetical protein
MGNMTVLGTHDGGRNMTVLGKHTMVDKFHMGNMTVLGTYMMTDKIWAI